MKSHFLGAASFIAASLIVLAGCASDPANQQTAQADAKPEAKVSCAGVQPAVGTLIVRKEDCNAKHRSMTEEEKEEILRRSPIMTSPAMGKGVGG